MAVEKMPAEKLELELVADQVAPGAEELVPSLVILLALFVAMAAGESESVSLALEPVAAKALELQGDLLAILDR